eukprot:2095343-Alexandrium_andersonii.AAC.1
MSPCATAVGRATTCRAAGLASALRVRGSATGPRHGPSGLTSDNLPARAQAAPSRTSRITPASSSVCTARILASRGPLVAWARRPNRAAG